MRYKSLLSSTIKILTSAAELESRHSVSNIWFLFILQLRKSTTEGLPVGHWEEMLKLLDLTKLKFTSSDQKKLQ